MHRHALLALFWGILIFSLNSQNIQYKLNANVTDLSLNGKTVYLQKLNDQRNAFVNIDSTNVVDNKFSFGETLKNSEQTIRFILFAQESDSKKQYLFMPENGDIDITIGENFKIAGTPKNEELQAFIDAQNEVGAELETIVSKYNNMLQTSDNMQKRADEINPVLDKMQKTFYNFAKSNINNSLGEYVTCTAYGILKPAQILELMSMTRSEFKDSELGKEVTRYYEAELLRQGGGPYKDIRLEDPSGKAIALSDHIGKNKLVLVDFWASWCGPCIKEMPKIAAVYQKYKDRGLEIVGVSLDENELSWKGAIKRLNMIWPQMSDLKGWKSMAAQLYGVKSIPYMILIDEKGDIIANDLYGGELSRKLEELLPPN